MGSNVLCSNNNNNGLFDLAARAGLDTQSTYILHIEPKFKKKTIKYSPMFSRTHETWCITAVT